MSVVKLGIVADLKEIDKTVGRLMTAMQPQELHRVAADRVYRQVKGKYPKRFSSQVNRQSQWQSFKKKIPGLPADGAPGFLTGTTFDSIARGHSNEEASIFLGGMWPKGEFHYPTRGGQTKRGNLGPDAEDQLDIDDVASGTKGQPKIHWGSGDTIQMFGYYMPDGASYHHISPERMENKRYGPPGREIRFMYLDNEDIDLVLDDMEKLLTGAIKGDDSFVPQKGEITPELKAKDISVPTEAEEPVTLEQFQSEIGVDVERYLQPLRAARVSEKVIEIERIKIMEFLKKQG